HVLNPSPEQCLEPLGDKEGDGNRAKHRKHAEGYKSESTYTKNRVFENRHFQKDGQVNRYFENVYKARLLQSVENVVALFDHIVRIRRTDHVHQLLPEIRKNLM